MDKKMIEYTGQELPADAVLYFWAPWCRPCTLTGPMLESVATQYDATWFKVNVDEHPEFAAMRGVRSIPTLYLEAANTKHHGPFTEQFLAALMGEWGIRSRT